MWADKPNRPTVDTMGKKGVWGKESWVTWCVVTKHELDLKYLIYYNELIIYRPATLNDMKASLPCRKPCRFWLFLENTRRGEKTSPQWSRKLPFTGSQASSTAVARIKSGCLLRNPHSPPIDWIIGRDSTCCLKQVPLWAFIVTLWGTLPPTMKILGSLRRPQRHKQLP